MTPVEQLSINTIFLRRLLKNEQSFSSESVENANVRNQLLVDFSSRYFNVCPEDVQMKLIDMQSDVKAEEYRHCETVLKKSAAFTFPSNLKFVQLIQFSST